MKRRSFLATGSAVVAMRGAPASALVPRPSLRDELATRAEATNYVETSTLADVEKFLRDLDLRGAPILRDSLGTSASGRAIPFVIASRPRVTTPAEAKALNRPIVLMVATLHGNEIDGKEALLAILRDLCLATDKTLLDDLVLAMVPVANPDGAHALGPQASNAPEQNGPERVGTLESGQGVDLDRDFVKLETPEIRGLMDFVNAWQPDVFVDLRTEGGSYADYGILHAPALHPAAFFGGVFARDRVLPAVHADLHEKFGVETFTAGHFGRDRILPAPPPLVDAANYGWFPPDYRQRHAANAMGVRGLVSATGIAYAHDPFERRVFCVRAFVESLLGYCSDNDDDVLANTKTMNHWLGGDVPIKGALPAAAPQQIVSWEDLALDAGTDPEPGVPPGFKRSGTFTSAAMPVFDRYAGTLYASAIKGYLVPKDYSPQIIRLLKRHGIIHRVASQPENFTIQQFVVTSIVPQEAVDRHRPIAVSGYWRQPFPYVSEADALVVSCLQTLGPLATVFLEPESDDSFFTWNAFEGELRAGFLAPVFRIV